MSGRYFFGIILILLGVGFLLQQADMIEFNEILKNYWPSLIILAGLSGLFDRRSSKFGNLLVIVFGVLLQLNRLEYFDFNVFELFWPAVLILIGINLIFSRGVKSHKEAPFFRSSSKDNDEKSSRNVTVDDTVDSFVMFAGLETNNQSQEFRGGKATALMGGIDLDLRGASLHNNEAYLELNAMFGGIDVFVPSHWRVEMTGVPVFGGWGNKTRPNSDPSAPTLKIKCFVMFGGVEVK